jgi:hypothetical protein
MFGFSHIVGETIARNGSKPARSHQRANAILGAPSFSPYRSTLPLDDSRRFRYLVSRHETRGQSGDCDWGSERDRKSAGVQEFRSSGVQEFRSSGVQEFRSSGVQEFRSSGVQEFSVAAIAKLQAPKRLWFENLRSTQSRPMQAPELL